MAITEAGWMFETDPEKLRALLVEQMAENAALREDLDDALFELQQARQEPKAAPVAVRRKWIAFSEAKRLTQEAGIKTRTAFMEWPNRPGGIPGSVDTAYGEEWTSWEDFLGTDISVASSRRGRKIKWRPFPEARLWAREKCQALGVTSKHGWIEWATGQTDRPFDIPARPDRIYKDEWTSWGDWNGTDNPSKPRRSF